MTIVLAEDTKQTSSGEVGFVKVKTQLGDELTACADFGELGPFLYGDALVVRGRLVPAEWSSGDYLWKNGAVGRLKVRFAEPVANDSPISPLLSLRTAAVKAIGAKDDAHALVQALACGYRRSINGTALYAAFQRCGLAHLVAVSGAHLVVVTGFAAALLRAARAPRRLTIALLISLMASYLAMSGMPVSALRATIMSSVGVLSLLGRRRPSAINALGVGMIAIIACSPVESVSVSFALSVLSTAGIVLFAPLVHHWLSSTPLRKAPIAIESLSLTLAANALSQLYACSVFNQLPLIAPLANVVCAPLLPLACGASIAAALFAAPALPGTALVALSASAASEALARVVGMLASIPFASIPIAIDTAPALVVSVALALALWTAWPDFKAKAVVPLCAAALIIAALPMVAVSQEDSVIMLDVGQGDAFLVRSRGSTLLVDTGNRDAQLVEQLAKCSALKLDAVLITHSDDDHCGSLDALEKAMPTDKVFLLSDIAAGGGDDGGRLLEQARRTGGEVVGVKAGDEFSVGAFRAKVIWPFEMTDGGGNADSLCLLLEYDGDTDGLVDFQLLFTGDAEHGQVEEMLRAGSVGDVDVLKVGHHGSKNALTIEQARSLDPEIALIGVGEGNRYGHPAPETLELLDEVGCQVYRSDKDGQVKCSLTPESISISLQ